MTTNLNRILRDYFELTFDYRMLLPVYKWHWHIGVRGPIKKRDGKRPRTRIGQGFGSFHDPTAECNHLHSTARSRPTGPVSNNVTTDWFKFDSIHRNWRCRSRGGRRWHGTPATPRRRCWARETWLTEMHPLGPIKKPNSSLFSQSAWILWCLWQGNQYTCSCVFLCHPQRYKVRRRRRRRQRRLPSDLFLENLRISFE